MSPRARVRLVTAMAALAAAGVAVGATLMGGGPAAPPAGETRARSEAPGLELSVVSVGEQADALREAERLYEEGRRSDARARFEAVLARDPSSLEASVGAAVASWPRGALPRLRRLATEHPRSGLVRLHLGLVLHAGGDAEAAERAWREALALDPDTPAALRAEDLLHPGLAPGRPAFQPRVELPPELAALPPPRLLRTLGRRARGGSARDWILYGVVLQRLARPVSARRAYERALELEPESIDAQTAAAVGRFEKADPSAAFSRLGPLARAHPRAAVVRFHLGLMLLWLRQLDEARTQLERAVRLDEEGLYGRQARRLLAALAEIRS